MEPLIQIGKGIKSCLPDQSGALCSLWRPCWCALCSPKSFAPDNCKMGKRQPLGIGWLNKITQLLSNYLVVCRSTCGLPPSCCRAAGGPVVNLRVLAILISCSLDVREPVSTLSNTHTHTQAGCSLSTTT